jgi:hypothetical protein
MSRLPTSLIALAAALAFAGCGSGGNGDTGASTASAPPPSPTTTQAANPPRPEKSKPDRETARASLPPPTPGSKAAAPGVPTSKEGDNSIQTWGLEASSAQRAQASATVQSYLNARAAGEWGRVCSHLATKPRREQGQYAGGVSCAKAMASFAAHAQTSVLQEEADINVLSFRVGHGYAFLIYHRPGDKVYAAVLTREGGTWKIVSVTPSPVE